MAKYTQDVKDKCVEAAKEGIALTVIQQKFGPNPKATQRYLKAKGLDYAEMRKELIKTGKLQGITKKNPAVGQANKSSTKPEVAKSVAPIKQ